MDPHDDAFERACAAVHALVLGNGSWRDVMKETASFLDSDGASFHLFDKVAGALVAAEHVGEGTEMQPAYFDVCPSAPAGSWFEMGAAHKRPGRSAPTFPPRLLRTGQIAHEIGFIVCNDGRWHAGLSTRRSSVTSWNDRDRQRIAELGRLLSDSFERLRTRAWEDLALLANVIDPATEAYCVVMASGRVILLGAGSEAILGEPNALSICGNQLVHRDPARTARLRAGIEAAAAEGSGIVVLPNGWGRSYRVLLRRLSRALNMGFGSSIGVRIECRDIFSMPSPAALGDLFGLTAAEARVAHHVVAGLAAADCAEVLGTSVATVRSQIAAILRKTGCNRQAEFIRLCAGL